MRWSRANVGAIAKLARVSDVRSAAALAATSTGPARDDREHLEEAIAWLERSHDACARTGLSIAFGLEGWRREPYPETSGYVIDTLLDYADWTGDQSVAQRAMEIGRWEIDIQHSSGAVRSAVDGDVLRVFNTGQVMLGWCALFERCADPAALAAAARAATFLIDNQDDDGAWRTHTYCGARTYHARVAWALLRVAHLCESERLHHAALASLRWVCAQQQPNGWFAACGFHEADPITHCIAYTIEGLVGAAEALAVAGEDGAQHVDAARRCLRALAVATGARSVRGVRGLVPASFSSAWHGDVTDSCLTGNVQLAAAAFDVARITGDADLLAFGDDVLDAAKRVQRVDVRALGIRGGLPGSHPLDGRYHPWEWPNWGTKFLADALLKRVRRQRSDL